MLVRQADSEKDKPTDITPKDFAVRTVAQEYGGGAFSILEDSVIFSNYKDQRLYKLSISSKGQSLLVCSFLLILQMIFVPLNLSCFSLTLRLKSKF